MWHKTGREQEERGAKMIKAEKRLILEVLFCCVVCSGRKISDEGHVIGLFKLNMLACFFEGICAVYAIFTAASDTQ